MSIAEGTLRNKARWRKEGRYADTDQIIKTLLALLSLSPPPNHTGPGQSHAGRTRVDWVTRKHVKRLHERETTLQPGQRGTSRGRSPVRLGGGGFVLGNHENSSVKHRRVECERISGLLDRIFEAAMMLEDKEEGGSSSSSFTAAADCPGRTATSNKDDQQRFIAEPLLALTQREHATNFRCGNDAAFRRRVDGLLAKNCARATCWGAHGGGRQQWQLADQKLRATIH